MKSINMEGRFFFLWRVEFFLIGKRDFTSIREMRVRSRAKNVMRLSWMAYVLTPSDFLYFFSSISEESENDSDDGGGDGGSLAPPSGRFGGSAAELVGVPGDGHEKENLLPNDQSDSIYLTN